MTGSMQPVPGETALRSLGLDTTQPRPATRPAGAVSRGPHPGRGARRAQRARRGRGRPVPGIQPADVEELLTHGARIGVLSRGMDLRLHVDPATLRLLADRSVEVHVAETTAAVDVYNKLAETESVGGLFHSSC